MKKYIIAGVALALALMNTACSNGEVSQDASVAETVSEEKIEITVSSESIDENGMLAKRNAAFGAAGENLSPQLSWNEVEGAGVYAVYMFDKSADNWLHLMATDLNETKYDEGAFERENYIGPYPPSGVHEYEIIVYALKSSADSYSGWLDSTEDVEAIEKALDTAGGVGGNIITKGSIVGKYSR